MGAGGGGERAGAGAGAARAGAGAALLAYNYKNSRNFVPLDFKKNSNLISWVYDNYARLLSFARTISLSMNCGHKEIRLTGAGDDFLAIVEKV